MLADYHTHTPLCQHAEGNPEDYIDQAIAANLAEYGISDHAPQAPEPFDEWRMLEEHLPQYFDWIARAQKHARKKLPVRAGLERAVADEVGGVGRRIERQRQPANEWQNHFHQPRIAREGRGVTGRRTGRAATSSAACSGATTMRTIRPVWAAC